MRRWAEGPTKTKLFQKAEGIPMNKMEIFTSEKNGIIRMCLKVYTNSCKSKKKWTVYISILSMI